MFSLKKRRYAQLPLSAVCTRLSLHLFMSGLSHGLFQFVFKLSGKVVAPLCAFHGLSEICTLMYSFITRFYASVLLPLSMLFYLYLCV